MLVIAKSSFLLKAPSSYILLAWTLSSNERPVPTDTTAWVLQYYQKGNTLLSWGQVILGEGYIVD